MGLASTLGFIWKHPLNRSNRLGALIRYVRWQVSSRLMPGLIAFPFVEDTNLFAKRGMTGATGNWYCGLHEMHDMGLVLHLLRPGDLFLDVGANVGSYTVIAAGAVGARVVAVEPVPSTFAHLGDNILLNGLAGRVSMKCLSLSDRAGLVRFTSDLDSVNHILADGEEGACIEVPATTLDDLVGNDVPVAIKIDVEGHEFAVLRGAEKTLSAPGLLVVVMEINGSGLRYGVSDHTLFDQMRAHGFKPYAYDPFERRLIDSKFAKDNTIFIRDKEMVERRVTLARRYRLINGEI
jgi:FkbM family methyltransferase